VHSLTHIQFAHPPQPSPPHHPFRSSDTNTESYTDNLVVFLGLLAIALLPTLSSLRRVLEMEREGGLEGHVLSTYRFQDTWRAECMQCTEEGHQTPLPPPPPSP
jgi:hypothetical protein